MSEAAGWEFDVEVHPPRWHFPAGATWLAGWIAATDDNYPIDLRVWVDRRLFLGLPGLPKPGMDERFIGRAGPPYTGFVAQVAPHLGAKLLRVEVRSPAGEWREIFRTAITVEDSAPPAPAPVPLAPQLPNLLLDLLRQRARHPQDAWRALADKIAASSLATPLDTLPNPPFHGALEEPHTTGRTAYHRLAVTGWLTHRVKKIRRLTAIVDGRNESPIPHGLTRTDVSTAFPDVAESEHVQFVGQVDIVPEPGMPALLKIFAELESGERELVFAQRFQPRISAGPDFALPPLSRSLFLQAWWSLRQSLTRLGARAGPLSAELSALRKAWVCFRAEAPGALQSYTDTKREPAPRSATPLRILAATHNLNFEGAPRLLLELLTFHRQVAGATAEVLSTSDGPMRTLFEAADISVRIVEIEPALRANTAEQFHTALHDSVAIDRRNFDLVIANTLVSFWAVHLAKAAGKPSLFYVHESAPIRRFFTSPTLQPIAESALRSATQVTFTAAASRRIFSHLDPQTRFRVLPTWLNLTAIDAFAAQHSPAELRMKHGIDPAALVVLNLGAVCARKGQHVFVRCASLLGPEWRTRHPERPIEFAMVGARGDDYQAALQQQAEESGLGCVRFVPETRENFDWLRLADVLVCTSFEESSPRVLLEAAAFRVPIVTTNVNGIPELVTDDEAWLVPAGHVRSLASALREALAAHLAGDRRRVERARAVVENRFDERVALPQHLALANQTAGH